MAALGTFLVAIAGPVAKRVLSSIGIGVVSYAGLTVVLNQLLSNARSAWSGLAGDVAGLVGLAGLNTAASIMAGALITRVSLSALKRFEPK